MKFSFSNNITENNVIYFRRDNWDDFGWKTYFNVYYNQVYLGDFRIVKIINNEGCNVTWNELEKDDLLDKVLTEKLPDNYYSLSREATYQNLYKLLSPEDVNGLLTDIRDVSFNLSLLDNVEDTYIYSNSLIRGINTTYLRETLSKISQKITDDKTNFDIYYPNEKWKMHFQNEINAILPSNLYAIIGNNGVGKTETVKSFV